MIVNHSIFEVNKSTSLNLIEFVKFISCFLVKFTNSIKFSYFYLLRKKKTTTQITNSTTIQILLLIIRKCKYNSRNCITHGYISTVRYLNIQHIQLFVTDI